MGLFFSLFRRARLLAIVVLLAFWGYTLFRHADELKHASIGAEMYRTIKEVFCKAHSSDALDQKCAPQK